MFLAGLLVGPELKIFCSMFWKLSLIQNVSNEVLFKLPLSVQERRLGFETVPGEFQNNIQKTLNYMTDFLQPSQLGI